MTQDNGWFARLRGRVTDALRATSVARGAVSAVVAVLVVCLVVVLVRGVDMLVVGLICGLLALSIAVLVYIWISPDSLRSQYTQQTLSISSEMLRAMMGGLTPESAAAVCQILLPETRATTIAITDSETILACVGELASEFPSGSAIRTPSTRYVLEHGIMQSFTDGGMVEGEDDGLPGIPAGIIAPLKVQGRTVGALKFYYRRARDVNRTQYALASGFADLLSSQLATIELDRQAELTARAEVRALQAQINPHFLFNTLNTIASLTRTDPVRARELLREFSTFYRATLENADSLIPVEREIAQTERYLLFEKARFGEERIVETSTLIGDVDDEMVPAFIIQPLVENAVRHAMADDRPLHIAVTVRHEGEEALVIEVADDGLGMDEETAARLFTGAPTPETGSARGSGTGIAMRNIAERIKRFYGPCSYTRVDSTVGQGTTIVLSLDLEGGIFASR